MNQFQIIANTTGKLFKKDELILDFTGYNDFLETYNARTNYDAEEMSSIVRESILWNDYLSEVINTINILLFSHITDYEAMKNSYSFEKNKQIIQEKLVMLKMLKKELYIQKQHCMNIYYQTMKIYEKSMKAFTINDYVNM